MFLLNSANSVTKILKLKRIPVLEPTISCVRRRDDTTLPQRHIGSRENPLIEPNSCFSDFSDFLNLLKSLKVLPHLRKSQDLYSMQGLTCSKF